MRNCNEQGLILSAYNEWNHTYASGAKAQLERGERANNVYADLTSGHILGNALKRTKKPYQQRKSVFGPLLRMTRAERTIPKARPER